MELFTLGIHTVSLFFAALNLVLLLAVLMTFTTVAEAPRAWTFLTLGLGLLVIHFALDVFLWTNQLFDFYGMKTLSATASFAGFLALFLGIHDVWEVLRNE